MGAQHRFGAQRVVVSANNIEALREARGWKRPELARRMGTSPQQVERLEKAQRRLTTDWIDKAAEAFGVPPAEIITASSVAAVPPIHLAPDVPATRSADEGETVEIAMLDLAFSMGDGTTIDDYIEEIPVRFDLSYVRTFTRTASVDLRIARGVGESMYPTLLSSDLVWIDTTQTKLTQQDRVWAISLYGAAAIKRLRRISTDRVLVLSDNPAVPDQEVDAADIIIGGRVIRFARDL